VAAPSASLFESSIAPERRDVLPSVSPPLSPLSQSCVLLI
jgi:hypothetical protein